MPVLERTFQLLRFRSCFFGGLAFVVDSMARLPTWKTLLVDRGKC